MISTVIAVAGTLLGAAVSGIFAQLGARRTERADRAERRRGELLHAMQRLSTAVSAHRRAMYKRGEARLTGASEERVQQLRDISHDTRGDVQEPLSSVRLLVRDAAVLAAADEMVEATFGMRRADGTTDAALTREGLTAARQVAVDAHDRFISAAAAHLQAL
ncbi:hypothetical protein [Streptomyces violaceusniger]|uniref:hypothetical protein n=1 Tax=Streptomyces violaceusniger TaxID=68280 RepID=UPI00381D9F32